MIHKYLSDVPALGRKEALALVPDEWRDDCAIIDLSVLPACEPEAYTPELALAYNVDTGVARVLGQRIDRKYEIGPREIAGTPDVIGLTSDAVIVPDYKTGKKFFTPETDWQLLFYSLVACRAFNKQRAITGIRRIREDGTSYWQRVDFDAFRLDQFEQQLRELVGRIDAVRALVAAGGQPETVEGDHCNNCASFDYCPSKTRLVRAVATAPGQLFEMEGDDIEWAVRVSVANATPEQLGLAYRRVLALEKVAERVKRVLAERATFAPIPLSKGQVLGPIPTIDGIDVPMAVEVLTEKHSPEVAASATRTVTTVSKDSIEKAIRLHEGSAGIGRKLDDAIDAISARGGVVYAQQVRPHKPKPEAKPKELPADAGEGASP